MNFIFWSCALCCVWCGERSRLLDCTSRFFRLSIYILRLVHMFILKCPCDLHSSDRWKAIVVVIVGWRITTASLLSVAINMCGRFHIAAAFEISYRYV